MLTPSNPEATGIVRPVHIPQDAPAPHPMALGTKGMEARDQVMSTAPVLSTSVQSTAQAEQSQPLTQNEAVQRLSLREGIVNSFKDILDSPSRRKKLSFASKNLMNFMNHSSSGLTSPQAPLTEQQELLRKAMKKTIKVEAKKLKANESTEIDLRGHKIVIIKNEKGNLEDILIKEKVLGKGSFGEVYQAISLVSDPLKPAKKEFALKQGSSDLSVEVEMLKEVNQGGPQEGVQSTMEVTHVKKGEILTGDKICKGRVYSHGSLQGEVNFLRISTALEIPPKSIRGLEEREMDSLITKSFSKTTDKINDLIQSRNELSNQNKYLFSEINSLEKEIDALQTAGTGDKENLEKLEKKKQELQLLKLERATIHENINLNKQEIERLGESYLNIIIQSLNAEKGAEFIEKSNEFFSKLIQLQFDKERIQEELNQVFREPLKEAMKKAQKSPGIDLSKRMQLASNLCAGLQHIHQMEVIHGDIKPANFLWDGEKAVIGDFGGTKKKGKTFEDPSVTRDYSSLEAIRHYGKEEDEENWFRAGKAADMRALGISLYEMFTGENKPLQAHKKHYYNDETYHAMKVDMINVGVPVEAATIIAKMSKPFPFDSKNPPHPYPLPVTEQELRRLTQLLK